MGTQQPEAFPDRAETFQNIEKLLTLVQGYESGVSIIDKPLILCSKPQEEPSDSQETNTTRNEVCKKGEMSEEEYNKS